MPWVQASGKLQKVQGQLNEKKPCLLAFREEFLSLYLPVKLQALAVSRRALSVFLGCNFFFLDSSCRGSTMSCSFCFLFSMSIKKTRGMSADLACNVAVVKGLKNSVEITVRKGRMVGEEVSFHSNLKNLGLASPEKTF